jgi:LPXTG-motif cell wall-anchored protein
MWIVISNSLALLRWHNFRFFHGHFRHGDVIWLVIGLALVGVVVWAFSRRRRRWL